MWQPIETAKWDDRCGPPVLVYLPSSDAEYRILVARMWGVWETVEEGSFIDPTHWMPLPAPPESTP